MQRPCRRCKPRMLHTGLNLEESSTPFLSLSASWLQPLEETRSTRSGAFLCEPNGSIRINAFAISGRRSFSRPKEQNDGLTETWISLSKKIRSRGRQFDLRGVTRRARTGPLSV